MFKLIISNRGRDDLSIGFDRDRNKRYNKLARNRNRKGKYRVRIKLKDVFRFVEHMQKPTYGLGCKLTPRKNNDESVLDKDPGIADARITIDHIHWYVPHYTPSIQQRGILSKQIISKTPKELQYIEKSVYMKKVNNQNHWNLELGSQKRMNVLLWLIIAFQQRDRRDSQNLNNITFCRLPLNSAECNIGTENILILKYY